MPEKKRGFHALEKRIHEIEEEDRTAAQRREPAEREDEAARREATPAQATAPRK